MEPRILALGNFVLQIILFGVLIYSGYIAGFKRELGRHCTVMRVAVPLLIISAVVVMLPSMLGYSGDGVTLTWFIAEMYIHHTLGLAVIGLWVFANLAQTGRIRLQSRLLPHMRAAAIIWVITFIMGVHIYLVIWV